MTNPNTELSQRLSGVLETVNQNCLISENLLMEILNRSKATREAVLSLAGGHKPTANADTVILATVAATATATAAVAVAPKGKGKGKGKGKAAAELSTGTTVNLGLKDGNKASTRAAPFTTSAFKVGKNTGEEVLSMNQTVQWKDRRGVLRPWKITGLEVNQTNPGASRVSLTPA